MKHDVNLLNRLGCFAGGFGCAAMLAILLDAWGEAPVWMIAGLIIVMLFFLHITWDSVRGKLKFRNAAR